MSCCPVCCVCSSLLPPAECSWRCDEHRGRCGAPSMSSTAATSSNPYKCVLTLLTGGGERWQHQCVCATRKLISIVDAQERLERTAPCEAHRLGGEKRGGVKRLEPAVSFPPRSDWTYFGKTQNTDQTEATGLIRGDSSNLMMRKNNSAKRVRAPPESLSL